MSKKHCCKEDSCVVCLKGERGKRGPTGGTGPIGPSGLTIVGPTGPTGTVSGFTTDSFSQCDQTIISLEPDFSGNVSLVLVTQGSGAIIRQNISTPPLDGQCRGAHAVDLQTLKTSITQVASGDESVITGGSSNTASGRSSVIAGGGLNTASDTFSVVCGGSSNTASGFQSSILGGSANTASGIRSTVTGGGSNGSSGTESTVVGGSSNLAFATQSVTLGGSQLSCTNTASVAMGDSNLPGVLDGSARMFMIGGGSIVPLNIFSVTSSGDVYATGTFHASTTADFAEYFESVDGSPIPVGTPVYLLKGPSVKISSTKTNESDLPFGVISKSACFIGNCAEEEWSGTYQRGSDGGLVYETYEDVEYHPIMIKEKIKELREVINWNVRPPIVTYVEEEVEIRRVKMIEAIVIDKDGEQHKKMIPDVEVKKVITKKKVLNPKFDPKSIYIPRSQRKEWHVVGLLGICKLIKHCKVNPNWIKISEGSDFDTWLIK